MSEKHTNPPDRGGGNLPSRLQKAKSNWRRTLTDYALSVLSVVVALAVLFMALWARSETAPPVTQNVVGTPVQAVTSEAAPAATDVMAGCLPRANRGDSPQILLLAADDKSDAVLPQLVAMREALSSYFGLHVQVEDTESYAPELLNDVTGLVVFANAEFSNPQSLKQALTNANDRNMPLAWIGPHGAAYGNKLGLTFDSESATAISGTETAQLIYKDVHVPLPDQPLPARFPVEPVDTHRVLGHVYLHDGTTHPSVLVDGRRAYVGFLPLNRFNAHLSLTATIDALSYVFGRHEKDPRVLFRLEDINGLTYAQRNEAFSQVADLLMENGVFMHLGIIPEVVDEDQSLTEERVITDISAATGVVELVKKHPESVMIVQHGFRHSRRDPRNEGCEAPGCAYEFFGDDDETMGPAAAAAFARERLVAGKAILERHLGPVIAFEAPHYLMSLSQSAVAEDIYPLILHPLSSHAGYQTDYLLPWITYREPSAYAPSSVGYVRTGDPSSVDDIVNAMTDLANILPDPIVVVFYHPFLANSPDGLDNLKSLITRTRQAGYRFANLCEELETAKRSP